MIGSLQKILSLVLVCYFRHYFFTNKKSLAKVLSLAYVPFLNGMWLSLARAQRSGR